MNWLRNSLIGGIIVVAFLLFIQWNEFQAKQHELTTPKSDHVTLSSAPSPAAPIPNIPEEDTGNDASEVPQAPAETDSKSDDIQTEITSAPQASKLVNITTDNAEIIIDTLGGDIVKVALRDYKAKLDGEDPFVLLNRTNSHIYVAQSGLIGPNGTDDKERPVFSVESTNYELRDGEDSLTVDLTLKQDNANIIKRFTFHRGSHLVNMEYLVTNNGSEEWKGNLFGQIKRDSYVPPSDVGIGIKPFLGGAITTDETHYKKIRLKTLNKKSLKAKKQGGWVAMIQHYFISAWIPDADTTNHYNLRKSRDKDIYLLTFTSEQTTIAPNTTGSLKASFYAGPKIIRNLEAISPYLDLTIDFGWLWMIAKPLHYGLLFIFSLVGNWGIAIILLTLCIKTLFFYPAAMSYRSMAKMRKIQPLMADLKERYGEDRQKMSSELMKLYKKEKVNPLGGCLPVVLQMPVFISLYWTLMESVELRHSPFFLWIADLSVKDPHFVLPLVMGLTMWIQQKLNPTPPDPMQAKVMKMLPIVFTGLFMMFPAGLVLYWVVNNTLSITQQYIITRQIEKAG